MQTPRRRSRHFLRKIANTIASRFLLISCARFFIAKLQSGEGRPIREPRESVRCIWHIDTLQSRFMRALHRFSYEATNRDTSLGLPEHVLRRRAAMRPATSEARGYAPCAKTTSLRQRRWSSSVMGCSRPASVAGHRRDVAIADVRNGDLARADTRAADMSLGYR